MFKLNEKVKFLGADWFVKKINTNGDIVLKSGSKHFGCVTAEAPYTKHIHAGWHER